MALPGAAPGAGQRAERDRRSATARSSRTSKCTLAGGRRSHLATWLATLGESADLSCLPAHRRRRRSCATSSALTFKGEGGKLDISGAFLGSGAEHIDTTLVVDHAVPGCESRELFKGVLADQARGIFQGKVIVRARCAEDRRQADGAGADAVAGRRVRFQAGARDLRRRRGLRPRLDRRPSSTRTCCSTCASRGIPQRRRARC